jgi:hypothetical protein
MMLYRPSWMNRFILFAASTAAINGQFAASGAARTDAMFLALERADLKK